MKYFYFSHICTLLGLALAYWWGGIEGLSIAALLMAMEISLSFDNAVVNASILKDMDAKWRKRFLTWGILIAVFGMRLIFPIIVVALATGLGVAEVTRLAFENPDVYSQHVLASNVQISAFGGMFLLMVFLHFLFDETKKIHWIGFIERKLAKAGKLESAEFVIALLLLLGLTWVLPAEVKFHALISGAIGIILYVAIHSIMSLFGGENSASLIRSGLIGFLYLQVLDASFSLDGVVGAFAISKDVVIIMIGLGAGALFVRSLTVYFVYKGTLDNFVYLEHGAHWGIGVLAGIMLVSTMLHVPEIVTGLAGMAFIGLSLLSSVKYNRSKQ